MFKFRHVPFIIALAVLAYVLFYLGIIPFENKEYDVLGSTIPTNTQFSCNPPIDTPIRSKYEPSPLCGEYQLPSMPEDIADLVLGVDLPELAPENERNPAIIWDISLLRELYASRYKWNSTYPLCTIPPSFYLIIDALEPIFMPNWKTSTAGKVPCSLISPVPLQELGFSSTLDKCNFECFRHPTKLNGSLAILRYAPSIVFPGVLWLPPRFLWMLSRYRSPDSVWVQELRRECLTYYPFWSHPFYRKIVNFTVGYSRTDFDVPVIPRMYTYESYLRDPPPLNPLSERKGTALIFYLQSNCWTNSNRQVIVQELKKYMKIDILGPCARNKPIPDWAYKYGNGTWEVKRALLENYPFILAMENSIATDYVTEKFWQPLAHGCVPVYLGPDTIRDLLPTWYDPDNPVYIDIQDWDSLENLAFYLNMLAANETMWNRFHRWRNIPRAEREANAIFFRWLDAQTEMDDDTCGYCKYIHKKGNMTLPKPIPPTNVKKGSEHPVIHKALYEWLHQDE